MNGENYARIVLVCGVLTHADNAVFTGREKTGCEVICTFTFQRGLKGQYRTIMGLSPAKAAQEAIPAGAQIVVTNYGNGMEQMFEIMKEMRAAGSPS